MNDLLHALGLLTALPVRARPDAALEAAPGRAMWAYPLAGAVLGLALALCASLLAAAGVAARLPLLAAALVLAAWYALTGALHLDGWADCCDALFVPADRERRLAILRDPRLGSFGATGLVLLLLLKLAAIEGVLAAPAGLRAISDRAGAPAGFLPALGQHWPLVVVPMLARWCLVLVALAFPLARPDGMAAHFRRGLGLRELALGGAMVFAVCSLVVWWPSSPLLSSSDYATAISSLPGGWRAFAAWAAGAGAALALARLAADRLGGLTGDVYGGCVELAETVALLAVCLL